MPENNLTELARLARMWILKMSGKAGSGHPTSSLSAADLIIGLLFGGGFAYDVTNPQNPENDRLIFSKGHASPLFYAAWAVSGAIDAQELLTFRKLGSRLEGHPTRFFPFTETPTGSLGQGLSVGFGEALALRSAGSNARVYVLLGDSEMAEGQVWEAMQLAANYKLDNLVAIADVNRLGQRGETMLGGDTETLARRAESFGWQTLTIDGHDFDEIQKAFVWARGTGLQSEIHQPKMIIARTVKGKGVSFMEDKDGWHGRAPKPDELEAALEEIGQVDQSIRGTIAPPLHTASPQPSPGQGREGVDIPKPQSTNYKLGDLIATRKAYGNALVRLGEAYPQLVVLDAEVSNSTYADIFKKRFPERFYEMYIAEQNMASAALGMAARGKLPAVSTFAAFFARAFDQIRMSQYSGQHIVFCGSHAGVSIGEDGSSQMGLEDIAMFRSLRESTVLYPSDAVSCERLVEAALSATGLVYLRTTRMETPVLYEGSETFPIGGSKVIRSGDTDSVTLVGAGATLHEVLAAADILQADGIQCRVIDLYSVKPIDSATLQRASQETRTIFTIEDHYLYGGIGEAVAAVLAGGGTPIRMLAVKREPRSGKPDELLREQGIDRESIAAQVRSFLSG